ncbi:MAG: hypothetical protein ACI4X9_01570 [Kiritimatiellia bacterium]
MSKQIALIRLLDLENWLRGVTFWTFPATCTPGQFRRGAFSLADLDPHLCCREFESSNPLFVEFEAEGNQPVPYTAVTKLYARDNTSREDLKARYPYWPCDCIPPAVSDAIVDWKKAELLDDALRGGRRLCELCNRSFTLSSPEENLEAWIDHVVLGTKEIPPAAPAPLISRILAYSRHKPMKDYTTPCSRAIGDIGLILRDLTIPNAADATSHLRIWLKNNHALETAPDFERNALCFLKEMRLRPKACGGVTSLASLVLYLQWFADLADYQQADFAALKQHLAQVTDWGFGEEATQALWLFGCRLHASNFAPEYIRFRWRQAGKGVFLPEPPFCSPKIEILPLSKPHPQGTSASGNEAETASAVDEPTEPVATEVQPSPTPTEEPPPPPESTPQDAPASEPETTSAVDEPTEPVAADVQPSPASTEAPSSANKTEEGAVESSPPVVAAEANQSKGETETASTADNPSTTPENTESPKRGKKSGSTKTPRRKGNNTSSSLPGLGLDTK